MQPVPTCKPGELVFAAVLAAASLFLLGSAYGIAGFESLSSPGAIPMATTLAMVITSILVLVRTARGTAEPKETFFGAVLPARIAILAIMLITYAIALRPLGFLPTSGLFLVLAIRYLSRRSWGFSLVVGLASLVVIYLIFRIVFTVLMPAGIVPEGEILAWLRSFGTGGE